MATKSIFKSVSIKGSRQLKAFVSALEQAERGCEKNADARRPSYYEVRDPEQINALLCRYRNA